MKQCNTCAHKNVCYRLELERRLGGEIRFSSCEDYSASTKEAAVDEDLALAFLAGAAAIEQSGKCNGLFTVGSIDQRTIPFADAARALRRAGQHYLKMG